MQPIAEPRTWRDQVRRTFRRWRREIRLAVLLVLIFLAAFAAYADEAPVKADSFVSHPQVLSPFINPGVCP